MKQLLASIHENHNHHRIVNIGDMKVSGNPNDTIVTYALGSCIGMTLYDPKTRVGGMIHCKFDLAESYSEQADSNPLLFVDTGFSMLLKAVYSLGAEKRRLIVKLAGASMLYKDNDMFKIGEKNYKAARELLSQYRIPIRAEEVGGNIPRTLYLSIKDGQTLLRTSELVREL